MNRIKEVLEEKGIKQTWLAEKLEKSYNMVNSYVQNRRQPSLEVFFKISRLLDVRIDELLSIEQTLEDKNEIKSTVENINEGEVNFNSNESTERVPLVGSVSCGTPIFAEENIVSYYSISKKLIKQNHRYFILQAFGDSMDKSGINNGDLVLVRLAQTADSGEKVVALIDNEATIKEIQIFSDKIILKPNSTNNQHQPIILTKDFRVQGIVVTVIPT